MAILKIASVLCRPDPYWDANTENRNPKSDGNHALTFNWRRHIAFTMKLGENECSVSASRQFRIFETQEQILTGQSWKVPFSRDNNMGIYKQISIGLFVAAIVMGGPMQTASGAVVYSAREATEFPQATIACKVKMGAFPVSKEDAWSLLGQKRDLTCEVISTLKGQVGKKIQITFRQNGEGPFIPEVDAVKPGEVYVVMLRGTNPPFEMFTAMKAVDAVVEPTFGTRPGDRLLAELMAMWHSKDARMRMEAIKQIGLMQDLRGSNEVNAAAQSANEETARAGVIAQHRMKITPDAKRVVELLNEQMLEVWCQESGIRRKDPKGREILRRVGRRAYLECGLPDFDYATFIREGIKKALVRKDDHTLGLFFGIPWTVQRQACVPELVKLLEHPDKKVRWWAVRCFANTVEDKFGPLWVQYESGEEEELAKWRKWWKEKGAAYMAEPEKLEVLANGFSE